MKGAALVRANPRWIWLGYWGLLLVIMHIPLAGHGGGAPRHADKVVHFAAYFILAWLGGRQRIATDRVRHLAVWGVVYAIYAAADEWLQPYTGRSMELGDWIADMCGVVAASVWLLTRRGSEKSGPDARPDAGV